jgi:limonene-1,2-epoxide hydrolase
MSTSPEQVVRDFSAAFLRKDIEYIIDAMTEDCVYANVPIPAMHGKAEVRRFITSALTKADKLEFIIVNIATAADGRSVLTERVDVFSYATGQVSVPLMGVFVLRGAKIAEWRDYADIGSFVREMSAIGQMPGVAKAGG